MIKEIMLSQILAMIAVSFNTKRVTIGFGDLQWREEKDVDVNKNSHIVSIEWYENGNTKARLMDLCMSLVDKRKPYKHAEDKDKQYILHAYNFDGDNCNTYTRFLYEIIANDIDIIDDIGLVGGKYYNQKGPNPNLLKINPHELFADKVNHRNRYADKEI